MEVIEKLAVQLKLLLNTFEKKNNFVLPKVVRQTFVGEMPNGHIYTVYFPVSIFFRLLYRHRPVKKNYYWNDIT